MRTWTRHCRSDNWGTPLVGEGTPKLPEVVGNAEVLVRPRDVDGFAAAIGRIVEDLTWARALGGRGRARARAFSWEAAARSHAARYREVAAERAAGGAP